MSMARKVMLAEVETTGVRRGASVSAAPAATPPAAMTPARNGDARELGSEAGVRGQQKADENDCARAAAADQPLHHGDPSALALRFRVSLPYTGGAPATPGRGPGSPETEAQQPRRIPVRGFLLRSASRFYGGTCGEGRKPLPVPLSGPASPACPAALRLAAECDRLLDLSQRSHHG